MIKMHKHSKYVVILLIFFLSIVVGIKMSNLISILNVSNDLQLEESTLSKTVENLHYYRKLRVVYESIDINNIIPEIKKITPVEDISIINSERKKSFYSIILEVDNDKFDEFYEAIHTIPDFESESIFNDNLPDYNIDIDEHINIKELAKGQLQGLITHSSIPERLTKYNNQLENIQVEIDSLFGQKTLRDKYKNYTLVSIFVKQSSVKNIDAVSALKKFLIYTSVSLILFIIFFTILFIILVYLLKFMKVIGIRTSATSSSNYYSPKRKKIKRKYKGNDSGSIEK